MPATHLSVTCQEDFCKIRCNYSDLTEGNKNNVALNVVKWSIDVIVDLLLNDTNMSNVFKNYKFNSNIWTIEIWTFKALGREIIDLYIIYNINNYTQLMCKLLVDSYKLNSQLKQQS